MKSWQIWTSVLGCIAILGAGALTVAVWNNISTEWDYEATAAQYALNHTPIDHLTTHDVFTGSGDEEVFSGQDTFGRKWYAFVSKTPFAASSVPAQGILTNQQIRAKVENKFHMKVRSLHLGYLNDATTELFHTKSRIVFEVYGSVGNQNEYLYLDAYNGTVIWQPVYS
jgi:uncharacterized protein YpmB